MKSKLLALALLTVLRCVGAVEPQAFVVEEVCGNSTIKPEVAVQAAFFAFKRQDGFACANRIIATLISSGNQPGRVLSSRLLWAQWEAALENAMLETAFRNTVTEIRLAANHPLRGEARLAQLFLNVQKGNVPSNVNDQVFQIMGDLNFTVDISAAARAYEGGSVPYRTALRWLFGTGVKNGASLPADMGISDKLYALAGWGTGLMLLGAASPELFQTSIADAWQSGRRLVVSSGQSLAPTVAYPDVSGQISYTVCADDDCRQQASLSVTNVKGQVVEARKELDYTDGQSFINYFIGSTPIYDVVCQKSSALCQSEGAVEVGRSHVLSVYSFARGGAKWKNAILKSVAGIEDKKGRAQYDFLGEAVLPACNDAQKCAVVVNAIYRSVTGGHSSGVSRSVLIVRPDGTKSAMVPDEILTLDRSVGTHTIQFHLSRDHYAEGSSAAPPNDSTAVVSVWTAAKFTKASIDQAKQNLKMLNASLAPYLPVALAAQAMRLVPANLMNEPPAYLGLGEALGQYADANVSLRWDRIYFPLLYAHVIRSNVGPELLPEDRRELELTTKILSGLARERFATDIDAQISLLNSLQSALSVAVIDLAIVALQKEQKPGDTIDPLVQQVAQTSSKEAPGDVDLAEARQLIGEAAKKDNLLEAVLLLYKARDRMQLAADKVKVRLQLLTVEKTGLTVPGQ